MYVIAFDTYIDIEIGPGFMLTGLSPIPIFTFLT